MQMTAFRVWYYTQSTLLLLVDFVLWWDANTIPFLLFLYLFFENIMFHVMRLLVFCSDLDLWKSYICAKE